MAKGPIKKKAETPPGWASLHCTKADAIAIQAVNQGVAEPDQQKRALDWIIKEAARTHVLPYWSGEDGRRGTDFACGRSFAGHQIVKVMTCNITQEFKDE